MNNWSVNKTTIERITLTGAMGTREEAHEWLEKNGFHIIRTGPFQDAVGFDRGRFLIVAEKESVTATFVSEKEVEVR